MGGRSSIGPSSLRNNAYDPRGHLALSGAGPSLYTRLDGVPMSTLIPFLALEQPGEVVQAWVTQQLTAAGFHLVQTFDLQAARLSHEDCPCPHHGTDACDCQLVVLLVYYRQEEPSTLVIHSRDHSTWISIAGPVAERLDLHPEHAIQRTIQGRLPRMPAPAEAGCEHKTRPAD